MRWSEAGARHLVAVCLPLLNDNRATLRLKFQPVSLLD
jgi:hypothetical protein